MKREIMLSLTLLFIFSSVYSASATGSGELTQILNEPWVKVNNDANITAVFQNIGDTPVVAKFVTDIYFKDKLTATVTSDQKNMSAGEKLNLTISFAPKKVGVYLINGHVEYDNKSTDIKESSFNAVDESVIIPLAAEMMLAVLVLIPLLILYQIAKRRFAVTGL